MALCASPHMQQSSVHTIPDVTPDGSKSLAIRDGVVLYSLKHGHLKYVDDLIESVA